MFSTPQRGIAIPHNCVSLALFPSCYRRGRPVVPRYFPILLLTCCTLVGNPLPAAEPSIHTAVLPAELQLAAAEEARASTLLTETRRIALNDIAILWVRDPVSTQADEQWRRLLASISPPLSPEDQRLLLRWTLHNAFLEINREMQFHDNRAERFEDAQDRFLTEARRARTWIKNHRAAGAEAVDPPFLPDAELDRPDPIRGPKPPVADSALATLQAVNLYTMRIERQYVQMGDDAQLTHLAAQRAGMRQRRLLDHVEAIMARLVSAAR